MTMECYCDPVESDDYCQAWVETWPRARKPHKCCECGEMIPLGHLYQKIGWVHDGTAGSYKTCSFCAVEFERIRASFPELVKGELACALVADLRHRAEQSESVVANGKQGD